MAIYGAVLLVLELIYSGETVVTKQKLAIGNVVHIYKTMLKTKEYSIGVIILGISYAMVMVFAMSMPFIVENQLHLSPVVTGYCALASGVAIFFGGLLSKKWVDKSLYKKLWFANGIQLMIALGMIFSGGSTIQLMLMMGLAVIIHFWQGFTYNAYFTFSLTRFPEYAATSSGLASGGSYLIFFGGELLHREFTADPKPNYAGLFVLDTNYLHWHLFGCVGKGFYQKKSISI